ncbi:PRD domain-containing protein [Proteiniclasticum sp. C24MP]|uniref:PRD domain-containing protein n=1 Tax=Proteiniclasticum sp. C24MP TaxID=3374101 RepID=UPI003754424F
MRIIKVFNNNIVATRSDQGEEMILTGTGLGFQKKPGDLVNESKIEKVYEVLDDSRDRFYRLLGDTPMKLIDATQKIRDRAKEELGIEMTVNALVGMIDHITYAVERKKQGMEIPNLMLHEIRSLYAEEFKIGLKGLEYIKEATGVSLSEHEAGYITMHMVNASLGENKESISKIFLFTSGIVEIIEQVFDIDFSEDEISLARLNSHLKFLAKRILLKQPSTEDHVEEFYGMFLKKDRRFKTVEKKIKTFVRKNFQHELSLQEMVYLMVHMNKAIS